jgi:hypothetical protein
MKKRILFFLSLSLVVGSGAGWFWLSEKDSVEAQSSPQAAHPLQAINDKARVARAGGISDAEEYIGEIIRVAGLEGELAGFTASAIKNRVGRAESSYRQGQAAGIPEAKIVRTVNGLARKFDLPDYVRTSNYEVRRLRLGLLPNFPQIITQKTQGMQPVSAGAQIDSQMSPAEAVFVLAMMLQQKLANPEYQLRHSERLNRWAETHNHGAPPSSSPHPAQNRSREIREALRTAAGSASMSDALNLSRLTLNTLGVEQ